MKNFGDFCVRVEKLFQAAVFKCANTLHYATPRLYVKNEKVFLYLYGSSISEGDFGAFHKIVLSFIASLYRDRAVQNWLAKSGNVPPMFAALRDLSVVGSDKQPLDLAYYWLSAAPIQKRAPRF